MDQVFHTNITAYCQQNRYVRLAIYTELFTLIAILLTSKLNLISLPANIICKTTNVQQVILNVSQELEKNVKYVHSI